VTGPKAGRSHRTAAEINSQPACWARAIELVRAEELSFPADGERVLVLGCGTSYYAGHAYALMREAAGAGVTDALVASDLPTHLRDYDRVVAISRSGVSTELLEAVQRMAGTPITAVLGEQGTDLADLADDVIDMSFAVDRSVVQTRFPTSFLAMARAALTGVDAPQVAQLPDLCRVALASSLPDTDIRQLVVLGLGWSAPLGQEAALKVRESAGMWAEAYQMGEYRHGPISAAGSGTLVWGLVPLPDDLVEGIAATGASIEHGGAEPLTELVRIQRFAVALAARVDRDADHPLHLTRSVVRG
jgi:glucosamine--fructose-6-phosphate aminotransferase (isomerizing)